MSYRDDQKLQVQQASDLVRLVGEHVLLRPRGKEFVGLCPFHDDKNPSMYVSPGKQIYKCFSCGAGGDAFSFAMNYHKMTFPEAMAFLAERAGIKLERRAGAGGGESGQEGESDRQAAARANAQAGEFFRALLRHGEHGRVAREYLAGRGVSAEMIEAFGIGYSPDRWDGLAMMIGEKGWGRRGYEGAGLISARSGGEGHYDRFRHRLMFPICDAIGRPIAFGGRKLRDEDEPKYLNSPESVLFNKSAVLYGLHLGKKGIIAARTAVLVEGYTDVIACHQAGVTNVVATLGTALTAQHVGELRRYCEKVVLIYDGDEAGIKASDRAVEVFLTEQLDVAIAVLPDDLDPADLLKQEGGVKRWEAAVAGAKDAVEYVFERLREKIDAVDTVTGRQKLAEEFLRKLVQLGLTGQQGAEGIGVVRRAMIYQRLSALLGMSEQAVTGLVKQMKAPAWVGAGRGVAEKNLSDIARPGIAPKIKSIQVAERQLIGCLLREKGLFHQALTDGRTLDEAVTPGDFETPAAHRLYQRVYQHLIEQGDFTLNILLAELAEDGEKELAELATTAEAEVEAACQDDPERLGAILCGAAESMLMQRGEREYQAIRGAAGVSEKEVDGGGVGGDMHLKKIMEHQRAHPSPKRMPVVKR